MNTDSLLVSKKSAAQMLSVSTRTIDNLIAAKTLPVRKIGRRSLVPRSALEQLARRDVPSPALEAAEGRDHKTKQERKGNGNAGQDSQLLAQQ